eukprot:5467627-Ditylum_brightwellii.AAC.1
MTGANCKEVDMLCTVIVQLGIKYHCEQMKYNLASSHHSKINMKVYQLGDYAGGALNEGVNLISETDDRENSEGNADADTPVSKTICKHNAFF